MDLPFDPEHPSKKAKLATSEKDVLELLQVVDWWITEDPSVVDLTTPAGEDFGDTEILILSLRVPIRRRGNKFKDILIGYPIPVKELLRRIYDFYQSPVLETNDKLKPGEDNRGYGEDISKPRYIDLMGMARQGRGSGDTEEESKRRGNINFTDDKNRDPYSCSGLVRFEGLEIIKSSNHGYELVLGS